MNRFILFTILIFLFSCGEKNSQESIEIKKEKVIKEYGYTLESSPNEIPLKFKVEL